MRSFTRLEIAAAQLDRALQLYLDERDHLAAITLASAAEAIHERLLEPVDARRGPRGTPEPPARLARRWRRYFRHKTLIEIADAVRTGLRLLEDEPAAFEPDDVARDVLERAIAGHLALDGTLTPRMRRFQGLGLDDSAASDAQSGAATSRRAV